MSDRAEPMALGRIRRTVPLAGFAARAASGRLVAGLRERTGQPGAVDRFHERTAERYTELLGHSKGVLMKAGQLMSMLDHGVVGTGGFAPYQKALTRLQADAPPMHPSLVREVLHAELGDTTDLFTEFDDEAMAAASIGQVHRAVLADGRDVVVKLQYPGVAQAIRDDLANTEMLATLLRFATAAQGLVTDIRTVAREAAARIAEEVDYRHEADMITAFGDLYRGHPSIRIPDVIPAASGERVLTMTYLDGMDWTAARLADQNLKNGWAEIIYRFAFGSFRHANLMHADPHPGNYRFHPDGSVGFLDFGCVKILPEPERWRLVATTRAFLDGRKDDLRELMVASGYLTAGSDLTADELYEWHAELMRESLDPTQPVTYGAASVDRVARGLFDIREPRHPVARMLAPGDHVMAARVHLAISGVCAGLTARLPVRAMCADFDGYAEPVTEIGKQHHAWVRQRGLPHGMDHHDQR